MRRNPAPPFAGTVGVLVAVLILAAATVALAAPDPQRILAASDDVRNPGRPFRVDVTLVEFQQGRQVASSALATYSRALDEGGQFASLVRFVAPARDAGKLMLKNGNDLWFYDPDTKASVRLSPQQRLLGQAANGDVVTVNLARDYAAEILGEEDVTDGERRTRRAYKLELRPAIGSATYGSILLWVGVDDNWPIKGLFHADSGRLLKTVYYRRFERHLGSQRPTELVIIDGLDPRSVTLMRMSEYTAMDIPAGWFQRDQLPRFQPER
ncbi:MAG: outer membrane lipoprotein-sorting protein [Burkholderiales bacterium]|nr:outer membrane lipoprotein-sorting protein [Burkholderiales bacterium]